MVTRRTTFLTWMDRKPPSAWRADTERNRHAKSQRSRSRSYRSPSRSDDHKTIRQVSSGRRSRTNSGGYSTEAGISQAKLQELNSQLGWSSEESSEPSNHLRVEKQRQRHSNNGNRHGEPELRKRSAEKRDTPAAESSQNSQRRPSKHRRDLTDDFYSREKPGHRRMTSEQPLVGSRRATQPSSRSRYRNGHRRRTQEIEKGTAVMKPSRRKWLIIAACLVVILVLIVGLAVGITDHKKHNASTSSSPANASLTNISPDTIPVWAKGTYLDPFTWYDTAEFNLTFTNNTVGGLSVMGLNTTFDNSAAANPTVPALTDPWPYGTRAVRGINIGGWLSLEPFITPSLFNTSPPADVTSLYQPPYADEWALSTALGSQAANALLDKHYSQFANLSTFEQIRAAGFDHVRIPFPYWAVTTYPGDPFIAHICWRYLLRGIEYARRNGLRVNLDLHSAPGSQNGWNHSGREGPIGWLNGTDGQVNADRTLQIHQQLSTFFAQDRYKDIVTMYGLLNEPRMIFLDPDAVINWTASAIRQIRASPLPNDTVLVFSDGFESLPYWQNAFDSYPDIIPAGSNAATEGLLLDSHEYVIFNRDQLMLNHSSKLEFACDGWSQQVQQSVNSTTGFGSFICGEWSQADTDCAARLNPEGTGNRWEGTLRTDNSSTSVLVPSCPLANAGQGSQCQCDKANADPSTYSQGYKTWLSQFADAQIQSFGQGWGSFYWTWDVEDGVPGGAQWSWKKGVEAGILPASVAEGRTTLWQCRSEAGEEWAGMGLDETY